jgi:hypothetical protein
MARTPDERHDEVMRMQAAAIGVQIAILLIRDSKFPDEPFPFEGAGLGQQLAERWTHWAYNIVTSRDW